MGREVVESSRLDLPSALGSRAAKPFTPLSMSPAFFGPSHIPRRARVVHHRQLHYRGAVGALPRATAQNGPASRAPTTATGGARPPALLQRAGRGLIEACLTRGWSGPAAERCCRRSEIDPF